MISLWALAAQVATSPSLVPSAGTNPGTCQDWSAPLLGPPSYPPPFATAPKTSHQELEGAGGHCVPITHNVPPPPIPSPESPGETSFPFTETWWSLPLSSFCDLTSLSVSLFIYKIIPSSRVVGAVGWDRVFRASGTKASSVTSLLRNQQTRGVCRECITALVSKHRRQQQRCEEQKE